jgi:hypothetical protein
MSSELSRQEQPIAPEQPVSNKHIPIRVSALELSKTCIGISLFLENPMLLASDVQHDPGRRMTSSTEFECRIQCGLCWENASVSVDFIQGSTKIDTPDCSFVENMKATAGENWKDAPSL